MRTWYKVQAAATGAETVTISVFDEIGMWGITAADFARDLKAIPQNNIVVEINSPGGSVFDGLAIYNVLRGAAQAGKTVTTKCVALAASIASIILMAGTHRQVADNAFVMVHNPWTMAAGNAEELRGTADLLDKIGESLVSTYVARTGLPEDEVRALLSTDTWMSAEEALAKGFVDEIIAGTPVQASFDLDRIPAHVRASITPAATAEPPAADDTTANPDDPDTDDGEDGFGFADAVAAEALAAGLQDHAARWALTCKSLQEVQSRIRVAQETKALCALLKVAPAEFLASDTPLAKVRETLLARRAQADEHVDTAPPPDQSSTPVQAQPQVAVKTADVWAKRRKITNQL